MLRAWWQAPHVHFLLLEAADILRVQPLPCLHVVPAAAPWVRLLRVPAAASKVSAVAGCAHGGSKGGSKGGSVSSTQVGPVPAQPHSMALLMLSSGALQRLPPCELQAAMAAALAPLALTGGAGSGHACASVGCLGKAPRVVFQKARLRQAQQHCCCAAQGLTCKAPPTMRQRRHMFTQARVMTSHWLHAAWQLQRQQARRCSTPARCQIWPAWQIWPACWPWRLPSCCRTCRHKCMPWAAAWLQR